MAQFSKKERERKIQHARQLWCKGFDAGAIADILGDVKEATVARWAQENDFEKLDVECGTLYQRKSR